MGLLKTRGGGDGGTKDSEESDEYESDEEENGYEEYEEDDESPISPTKIIDNKKEELTTYDALLTLPPFQQMGVTLGIMYFSKKIDFTDAKVIRWARICFLSYIILTQLFLFYVRIRAKQIRNTSIISQEINPILSMLLPKSQSTTP